MSRIGLIGCAFALSAAACSQLGGGENPFGEGPFEIAISTVPLQDSKCRGGFQTQVVSVLNTADRPYDVLPYCEVESVGVEVSGPLAVTRIMPGEAKTFTCVLEDFADPPDGFGQPASVRLEVFVGSQSQVATVPVVCTPR